MIGRDRQECDRCRTPVVKYCVITLVDVLEYSLKVCRYTVMMLNVYCIFRSECLLGTTPHPAAARRLGRVDACYGRTGLCTLGVLPLTK